MNLHRLDALAASLADDPGVVAVLGVGSAGLETGRFDEHSDIDFFVVTADAATQDRMIADAGWLAGFGGEVAWSFVNSRHGQKALFADGLFLEYAVFRADELPQMAYTGARVVWLRPGTPPPATSAGLPERGPLDTTAFHVDESLSNLFVGMHRELRGEHLTAMRFIQVMAVDRVLDLVRLGAGTAAQADPFDPTRRLERARPEVAAQVAEMTQGYRRNRESAAAVLRWLTQQYDASPAAVSAVRALLSPPDELRSEDNSPLRGPYPVS